LELFFLYEILSGQCNESLEPVATVDWSSKPAVMTGIKLNWEAPSEAIILLNNTPLVIKGEGQATRSWRIGKLQKFLV
jgi:hypothetical protein